MQQSQLFRYRPQLEKDDSKTRLRSFRSKTLTNRIVFEGGSQSHDSKGELESKRDVLGLAPRLMGENGDVSMFDQASEAFLLAQFRESVVVKIVLKKRKVQKLKRERKTSSERRRGGA